MGDQTPELEHTENSKHYLAQTVLMVLEEHFLDCGDEGPTCERFMKDYAEQIEEAFRKSDALLCAELTKIIKPLLDETIEEIKQFNVLLYQIMGRQSQFYKHIVKPSYVGKVE